MFEPCKIPLLREVTRDEEPKRASGAWGGSYPGGSLYQPVSLGVRDDIAAKGCTLAQLKFKRGDADSDG